MSSVPSPEYLSAWLRQHYGLGRNVRCAFWWPGLNLIFHVQDRGRKYALKIYRPWWRTAAQVDFELKELFFLRGAGLPVSTPLPAKKGVYSLPLQLPNEVARAVLFSFAEGGVQQKPADRMGQLAGALLARLHQTQDRFTLSSPTPPLTTKVVVEESLASLRPYRPSFGKQWTFLLK